MDGITQVETFIATVALIGIAVFVMTAVATVIEAAYERECRRNRPRPGLSDRERELLGEDWRDHAGRWSR